MGTANVIALTRDMLRFNTINPPGAERALAQHMGKLLEEAGFSVALHEFADARTSVIAQIGGNSDKPPICFTGHLDVVPLGARAWSKDPFAGETAGDKLYGRGSTDMKSGIAAFVVAALELAKHLRNGPGLVLVLTASEEVGCEGAKHLAKSGVLPKVGAIVVAEPTANYPIVGHKGLLWLRASASGKTAHGSMPEEGDNAIAKLAHAIVKMETFDYGVPAHALMGKPTFNIGMVQGGLNINSVPDKASFTLDCRTVPGMDHVHVCDSVREFLGTQATVEPIIDVEPCYTEPSDEFVASIYELLTPYLGSRPTPRTIQFSTDGPDLRRAMGMPPTVILGPGEPTLAHQTDEFCSIAKTEASVALFRDVMRRWCGV